MQKITYSLRTMFYYCLGRLKIRVSWVALLFARLRSVRSSQIGYSAVLLCCFIFPLILLLLSGSEQAFAQTPTQTPRPPLFPSSTPQPTLDFTCSGQPAGYGLVTPDAFWSLNCSQCITPIVASATPQPESTFTTALTQTAQPLQTSTATPTATPLGYCPAFTSTAPPPTSTQAFGSVTMDDALATVTDGSCTRHTDVAGSHNSTLTMCLTAGGIVFTFTGVSVSVYSKEASSRGIAGVYLDGVFMTNTDLYASNFVDNVLEYSVSGLANTTHTIEFRYTGTKNSASSGFGINVDKIVYSSALPTPTPTAPLVDNVSCSGGGNVTCLVDGTDYAKQAYNGYMGAGGSATINFQLYPANVPLDITYNIVYTHNEQSIHSANIVRDSFHITTDGNGSVKNYGVFCESPAGVNVTCSKTQQDYLYDVMVHPSNNRLVFNLSAMADYPVDPANVSFTIELWTYLKCPTVGGTATPSADGYCSEVLPDTSNGQVDVCAEGVFCAPEVTVGDTYCAIDLAPINIPLSVFGFTDVTIPAISVCFVQLYFGSITAWGVEIDVDWIVYVMAGSWVLHRLLAS